ncbi:MAG TPA: porin family protein [Nitrospiraceae bacterium]|nr:porin family protein [Nitrospiraceae bacterium]
MSSFTRINSGLLFAFLSAVLSTSLFGIPSVHADSYFFDDVEKPLFSIGGRGTYFDPNDASPKWYGGAQARLHLGQVFAIEGSVDYREKKYESTFTRSYPVQVSGLIYLLPGKRISPFILGGGGWYYTQVKGPGGFDDTQNRFGLHAGGGLQWMLNRHVSIDSTYRYIWLEKIESRDENVVEKKYENNAHMVTIGLNFHF